MSTSRVLALLELLQERPFVTGAELAGQLGVDGRTVRRYLVVLHELGVPVQGQRGPYGGYRLRAGYRLPPLMLSDDEAVAVLLGLAAAQRLGLATAAPAVEGALAKVRRVLPASVRRRVEALEQTLGFTHDPVSGSPPGTDVVLQLAEATRGRRRVLVEYTPRDRSPAERELSPYGLVFHHGRWYLSAFDHGRDDLRVFRVDRMARARIATSARVDEPPDGFDPVAHVTRSLARVPWQWKVEVTLEASIAEAATRIPATLGELSETQGGVTLRMRVASLDYMASLLAELGWPFVIHEPEDLRTAVDALAARLVAYAQRRDPSRSVIEPLADHPSDDQ